MLTKIVFVGATACLLTLAGSVKKAGANVMTFTDQAAFEASLSGASFQTETFDGAASDFDANSTGNVIGDFLTVDVIGGVGDPNSSRIGLNGDGFFEGEVDSSDSDIISLNFNVSDAVLGFGLLGLQDDSVSSPGGLDLEEIGVEVNGESFLVSDILGLTDSSDGNEVPTTENTDPIPFIGFTSDTPITSFRLLHGDLVAPGGVESSSEEFFINGVVIASEDNTESVPEPASILGLLALGGVALLKRKR